MFAWKLLMGKWSSILPYYVYSIHAYACVFRIYRLQSVNMFPNIISVMLMIWKNNKIEMKNMVNVSTIREIFSIFHLLPKITENCQNLKLQFVSDNILCRICHFIDSPHDADEFNNGDVALMMIIAFEIPVNKSLWSQHQCHLWTLQTFFAVNMSHCDERAIINMPVSSNQIMTKFWV